MSGRYYAKWYSTGSDPGEEDLMDNLKTDLGDNAIINIKKMSLITSASPFNYCINKSYLASGSLAYCDAYYDSANEVKLSFDYNDMMVNSFKVLTTASAIYLAVIY